MSLISARLFLGEFLNLLMSFLSPSTLSLHHFHAHSEMFLYVFCARVVPKLI